VIGPLTTTGSVRCGTLSVEGPATFEKCVRLLHGSLSGSLSFGDALYVHDEITFTGSLSGGVLGAMTISLSLGASNSPSEVDALYAVDSITVKLLPGTEAKEEEMVLKTKQLVSCGTVELEYVDASLVIGSVVRVGPGCTIDTLIYDEMVEVAVESVVNNAHKRSFHA
jgi:hypothetical protein